MKKLFLNKCEEAPVDIKLPSMEHALDTPDERGLNLYQNGHLTCHGASGQGVPSTCAVSHVVVPVGIQVTSTGTLHTFMYVSHTPAELPFWNLQNSPDRCAPATWLGCCIWDSLPTDSHLGVLTAWWESPVTIQFDPVGFETCRHVVWHVIWNRLI